MANEERTPAGVPVGSIADRLDHLARSLAGAGVRVSRIAGAIDGCDAATVAESLTDLEEILSDEAERVHGARRAVERIRRGITE